MDEKIAITLISKIQAKQYEGAWFDLLNYIQDNTYYLLNQELDSLINSIADYMRVRDTDGKFYGYLLSYHSHGRQLLFQKARSNMIICKLIFRSLRNKSDEFFKDRYRFEAKQFLEDMLPRRKEFVENLDYYSDLYWKLADSYSQMTLICLVAATVFLKYEFYEMAMVECQTDYYPEEIFSEFDNEIVVDCGGYIGDTAQWFINKFGDSRIRSYYLYEPDVNNAEKARKGLPDSNKYHIKAAAVMDVDGVIAFTPEGMSGKVADTGFQKVPSVTIDNNIGEPITYIKMDIEGTEIKALRGCRDHIIKDRPKLAICAYHKPDDFRMLMQYIISVKSDYSLFIRHYSPKHKESVMYFL